MGLDPRHDVHLVRPLLLRGPDAGRQDRSSSIRGSAIRRSPRTADSIERCDLLLVTHGHFDHMGDAVALASRLRPVWPCMHEMSLWLARRLPGGADAAIGMNKGGTFETDGIQVTMTHADHSAGDWNPGGETTLYLGDPVGFVVELENGFRFYFAGDTAVFGDMALIRELYAPRARVPADRRPLHDGPARGGPGGRAARRRARHADPLRDVPDPDRDAGGSCGRSSTRAGSADVRVHAPEPGGTVA